jgi:hypothetical protein
LVGKDKSDIAMADYRNAASATARWAPTFGTVSDIFKRSDVAKANALPKRSGRWPTPLARPTWGLISDILHRRCRCRRASTKASFVTIISTELVAEELPVWGTPSLQFPIQDQQSLAAKRTTNCQINVASTYIHRNPPRIMAPARIIIAVLVGNRLHE